VNRSRFLAGGASAVLLPTTFAPLARADASEGDVAYANFAIACELLMADYYARLLKTGLVHGSARSGATVARRNEGDHVKAFTTLLTDAGQSVPVADDFAFAWPAKTFRSLGAAAETGANIEAAVLGAYISAAVSISVESYRSLFARALADEARHLAVLTWVASGKPVGNSFPPALGLEEATKLVEPYLG
jgi:ferritin-like protein